MMAASNGSGPHGRGGTRRALRGRAFLSAPTVRRAMKRRRPFGSFALFCVILIGSATSTSQAQEEAAAPRDVAHSPQVVFVTGDDEYGSEVSMPMVAAILEKHHGMKATVLYAEDDKGQRDRHGNHIPGLEALRTADLAVFFMRYRQLPDDELREIVD